MNNFQQQLQDDQKCINALLNEHLPQGNDLHDAVRYGVLNGGKRLRAFLVFESSRIFQLDQATAQAGALAIETMHAYSLVHDDLPSMDNDDLRRGQPTVHVKWNEWLAILAGDALQTRAFEFLTQINIPAHHALELVKSLAVAAGDQGMVYGQFLDLAAETTQAPLSMVQIQELQNAKTGALIEWSACFGPRAAGQPIDAMQNYSRKLGLAFQIWDDVLDIEGTSVELGKTAGKDIGAGKATFVSLLGLEQTKELARKTCEDAKDAISNTDGADRLCELADYVIARKS